MKRKHLLVVATIALILVLVLAFLLLRGPRGEDFVLKRTDVDYSILASCTVSDPEPYVVTAKAAGDVVAVPVAEGQRARAGRLLVQLDDFRECRDLAIARSDAESARLKVVNSREEGLPQLREQLRDAEAELAQARRNAERLDALFRAGAIARVDWERARTAQESSLARFNQVKYQVDSYGRSGAAAELANRRRALDARVALARRAVADRRIVAPYDCLVVRLDVKPGEAVVAGSPVATVLERTPWMLEVNVDQKELPFLENDLPCTVRFDAFPAQPVAARVDLVRAVVDLDKGTCGLKLRVTGEYPFIRHGMSGSVEITARKVAGLNAGVLALPARYLVRGPGEPQVLLRGGRGLVRTPVTIVPIGEKWVGVRNLPEGARIALPR